MVYGVRFKIDGVWVTVYGSWLMAYGLRSMVYRAVYGLRYMVYRATEQEVHGVGAALAIPRVSQQLMHRPAHPDPPCHAPRHPTLSYQSSYCAI